MYFVINRKFYIKGELVKIREFTLTIRKLQFWNFSAFNLVLQSLILKEMIIRNVFHSFVKIRNLFSFFNLISVRFISAPFHNKMMFIKWHEWSVYHLNIRNLTEMSTLENKRSASGSYCPNSENSEQCQQLIFKKSPNRTNSANRCKHCSVERACEHLYVNL